MFVQGGVLDIWSFMCVWGGRSWVVMGHSVYRQGE